MVAVPQGQVSQHKQVQKAKPTENQLPVPPERGRESDGPQVYHSCLS